MAGAARLAGLPGKTRQSARRRPKFHDKKCCKKQGRRRDQRQIEPSAPTPLFAHRANPCGGSEPIGGTAATRGRFRIKKKFRRGYVGMRTSKIFGRLMLFGNSTAVDEDQCPSRPRRNNSRRSWRISSEVQASGRRGYQRGYRAAALGMLRSIRLWVVSAGLFDPEFAPALRADLAVDQCAGIRLLE